MAHFLSRFFANFKTICYRNYMKPNQLRAQAAYFVSAARQAAGVAVRSLIGEDRFLTKEADAAAEASRRQQLDEYRAFYWHGIPDYFALNATMCYARYQQDGQVPHDWYGPADTLQVISDGLFLPRGNKYSGLEYMFNSSITDQELHEKCVGYCARSAAHFVHNATIISDALAGTDAGIDITAIREAFDILVGDSVGGEATTVLKPINMGGAEHDDPYDLDYVRLAVGPEELGVPESKIMAGIGLTMALWVRLGDEGTSRTRGGHGFDRPLIRTRFWSLLQSSGWARHADAYPLPMPYGPAETQEAFLSMLRDPQFIQDTLAILKAPEE